MQTFLASSTRVTLAAPPPSDTCVVAAKRPPEASENSAANNEAHASVFVVVLFIFLLLSSIRELIDVLDAHSTARFSLPSPPAPAALKVPRRRACSFISAKKT